MKKFLSLVLALVMTMSLVTISAGAKNFTDDSKITYKDAVAVMSDIGVIDGYTGGGFQPTTTLTQSIVPRALRKAQDVQEVQDINNLGAYLTKTLGYVAKQWDDKRDSIHWWHYQELRYRLGIRDISMDAQSRGYITRKYKNPISGLSSCGETEVKWGIDNQDPDFTEPGDSGILGTVATGNCPKEERVGIHAPRTQAGRVIRPEPRVSCYMSNLVNRHTSKIRKYKIS